MRKVAIVGVEGSGKTVMLSGLGELYSRPDEYGFFLSPKNFQTASYVSEKIARMRRGEWPVATAEDVMQGLDWTLKRRQGDGRRPVDVCEVSCLDFAGEVYRVAFGIRQGDVPADLADEVESLREYIRNADDLIVLINLRDIIVRGVHEPRVQESMWITNEILSYALDVPSGRKAPRATIVLSQADCYADTISACRGPKGVLARYLPHVANNYDWLDIMAVSAVDRTVLDDSGNVVPAPDFSLSQLRMIMDWIQSGLSVGARGGASAGRPAPQRHTTPRPQPAPTSRPRPAPAYRPQPPPAGSGFAMPQYEAQPTGIAQYFSLRGRKNRSQFWGFLLFAFIGSCVTTAISEDFLFPLFVLSMLWPCLSNAVRRLHDVNMSGWWLLLGWTPIGWILYIIMAFVGGTDGDNKFGPRP